MVRVKTIYLLWLFVVLYLLTCYYVFVAVDTQLQESKEYQKWRRNARPGEWPVLDIRKNKNGSWQLLQDECPVHTVIRHSHLQAHFIPVSVETLPPSTCPATPDPAYHSNHSVIVMEEEWSGLDVGYPQYVYTVSGWIQVLQVPSYTAKPGLTVIIVPHSHQDVGWRETADNCYTIYARPTLNNAIQKLAQHSNWRFVWAETTFLARWYKEATEDQRLALKRAISTGQLEIVSGGWVMTEEACAHYAPMLDQLTEGHLWLKEELGIEPNVSWSVDPFGHSPTMAYLLQGAGMDSMVIQRVHFAIKKHLAKSQRLEFDWRQSWDESGATDIHCHMMPFLSYAILYSCGPDPHVCCQLDFTHEKCFHGQTAVKVEPVSKDNIKKLAWALWEQFQKKAQLYHSNVILVPHGDDFRYNDISEWDKQLGNMEKLMDYMNADRDMNIKVRFGTLSEYFKAVAEDRTSNKTSPSKPLPKLIGDFFPYNDRDDQYWTGFYSSRPLYKYMARALQAKLRCTEIVYSVLKGQLNSQPKKTLLQTLQAHYSDLQEARRVQATFMHHDAITGTSKKAVVLDYAKMLHGAINTLDKLFYLLLSVALTDSTRSQTHFIMNEHWPTPTGPPQLRDAELGTRTIMVTNPLAIDWTYVVKVRVLDRNLRVLADDGSLVRQQISPVWNEDFAAAEFTQEIVFEAYVPGLSVRTYRLEPQQMTTLGYASVTLYNMEVETFTQGLNLPFKVSKSSGEAFQIQNQMITATYSTCTGTLQHLMRRSDDLGHKLGVKFMTYGTGSWSNPYKDKSGAYIFMPDGPAKTLEEKYPAMIVVQGPLSSSIYTYMSGVVHVTTLYNVSGPLAAGVHVENTVNIGDSAWNNKELVMRLVSDVVNTNGDFCVDLNGFQMTRKQWRGKKLTQGNFHPMNTMAFIDNDHRSRLTLVAAQALGMASLNFGWMEVVLDRRLMQDDWRGMGEGVSDNAPTPSKFVILLEKRDTTVGTNSSPSTLCQPSLLAELTSRYLSNPAVVTLSHLDMATLGEHSRYALLEMALPCSFHLVNLRSLLGGDAESRSSALMVVHYVGVDCNFSELHRRCYLTNQFPLKIFKGMRVWKMTRTGLTGSSRKAKPASVEDMQLSPMELRTYKLTFS